MYLILNLVSSTGPSGAGAHCRARLRWHSSRRRSAGPGNYPGGLPRQGRIAWESFADRQASFATDPAAQFHRS